MKQARPKSGSSHPADRRPDKYPDEYVCGMCDRKFPSLTDLYQHQSADHDPDGVMFSELGLPK